MRENRNGFATLDEELSGVVRAEMSRAKISQREMALRIGMHPNVFGRKYRGEVGYQPSELSAIGNQLSINGTELMREAERRYYKQREAVSA